MYDYFVDREPSTPENAAVEAMEEEQPMTIEDDENLSTRMNCFLLLDDDPMEPEQLNFLGAPEEEEDIVFYSQNEIEPPGMADDFEAYFD
jgi:hypothetical protein